ncbi:MAG: glycosyltransferase [Sedimentisphaerales bacterium]|nr:glycosyltransferase [Sedimentisphaerales bacterium]
MITVFTSCYNQGNHLSEAIESVLNQTYSDFEYLIYDDGSTDNTWDIIQNYAQKDKRIRPFRIPKSPNVGVVINQSIKQAKGNVWTWCPSDDVWLPNLLEEKYKESQKYPDAILYSDWIIIDEQGRYISQVSPKRFSPQEFRDVVWHDSPIGFTGIWVPMKTFDKAGLFPENLDFSEDYYWMVKAAIHGIDFRCVPQVLYKKRTHSNTTTGRNRSKILEGVKKIREVLRAYKINLSKIPKKMYFFWANESMSWLRYMTLYSFKKLNPEWDVELYYCKPNKVVYKPWKDSPTQDFFNFQGKDYFPEVEKLGIAVKEWSVESIDGRDWENIFCSSHKSNIFKWQKMAQEGGFYSDLDILYLKPMDEYYKKVKNTDLIICYRNKYCSIGFLGSSPGNRFYRDIYLNAFDNFKVDKYQTVGVENIYAWLKKIANVPNDTEISQMDLWDIMQRNYPEIRAFNNEMELLYPWTFDRMEEVFHFRHTNIPENCIGIHWYAGDIISQKYNNLLTSENYSQFDNTYTYFASELINRENNSHNYLQKQAEDNKLVPVFKEFLQRDSKLNIKKARVFYSRLMVTEPSKDGLYSLRFGFTNICKQFENTIMMPYTEPFKEFLAVDPETNEDLLVTAKDVFRALRRGYDFSAANCIYQQKRLNSNSIPSVAFTVKNSSILGGGTLNVFEYANWLSDSGVDVAVYSDDKLPDWIDIKGRFYHIEDARERYSSITEPVIIVYSIFELQDLLYCCDAADKVIYHLCQGIEDHHYCNSTYESLMTPKTIFEFLFSMPVGRISVSPHISDYFRANYNQKTIDIFNGIDIELFKTQSSKVLGKEIKILSSGSPKQALKGKADIKEALAIVSEKYPDLSFTLTIACGQKNYDSNCFGSDWTEITGETNYYFGKGPGRYNCKIKYGLSQEQMCRAYYDSDIYINSSWYEGFGLPSIEAMACGIPVIQADNRGLDGIVTDRENCILIHPNNPVEMAQAIETLIKDGELRNKLAVKGIETAKRFTKEKQHEMFVREFEKILCCSFNSVQAEKKIKDLNIINPATGQKEPYEPVFTILVPTYNQAKYLPRTLESLINQTYENWEAVVVNDGSTDETAEILNHFSQRDQRIRVFHKTNGGVSSALNEGLRNARGKWICWLSSDDLFEPDKLKIHLEAIKENPQIQIFHTNYYIIDGRTNCRLPAKSDMKSFIPPENLQVLKFFEINYYNGISIAVHRDVFGQAGYFNENFRYGQDFDMWLRMSALYPSVFINKRTCTTRIHSEQGGNVTIGKNVYDSFGIYDSAAACLEFLNKNEFSALFPALDLSNAEHILFAIKNTLKVLTNPLSFINRCGYASALIDRMQEWLTHSEFASPFKQKLPDLVDKIRVKGLPHNVMAKLKMMSRMLDKPFSYQPYNPLCEMEKNIQELEKNHENERVSITRDYLAKVSQKKSRKESTDDKPVFSIIVPAYNQAQYLPAALDSLIKQTYGNWEAIIVNDGSTDHTPEIAGCYAAMDSRIRVVNKENGGVASALNEGIKNAAGKWICWLSSDDMFEPDKLEIHVHAFEKNPEIRFFHTNYYIFDEEKGEKCVLEDDPRNHAAPVEFQVLHYFDRNCTNGISIAVHREVFEHVGLFNEKYRYGQDFDMWLRICANYRALYIDRKTVITRWHVNQGTSCFPMGGFYDSARSCIEFLNSHTFSDCFTVIDLTKKQGAAKAIQETMAVIFNPNAMMYKCYFNTALLERLAEWVSRYCPNELKKTLVPYLQKTVSSLMNSQLPDETKTALMQFSENILSDFNYVAHNFEIEAAKQAREMTHTGQTEKAENIKKYLSLINSQNNLSSSTMESSEPLVSILMPAYNASTHIREAVESILSQKYRNYECIIADDGSTDNTRDIISGFKDERIKYIYKDNGGPSSARNMALKKSHGSFIIILDSDDMMAPDFISKHLSEFINNPEADMVYCDDYLIDENSKPIRIIERPQYSDRNILISSLFRNGFPVVPFRTCIKRSVFDKIGFFDEQLLVGEDYDMMRRFVMYGLKAHHLKEALYLRRMTGNSLSRKSSEQKAKNHFDVVRRYAETFTHEELFPDVNWQKIAPGQRKLNAKYLAAETFLAIGRNYIKTNSPPVYAEVAFEHAGCELNECMKIDPNNKQVKKMMQECELQKQSIHKQVLQYV